MSSCEWGALIYALAVAIAKDRTKEEIAFMSLLFSLLSSNLALLSTTLPDEGILTT